MAIVAALVGCGTTHAGSTISDETAVQAPTGELAQNRGFEDPGSPPRGWFRDLSTTGNKGVVERDENRSRSGAASVRIEPNRNNEAPHNPLAIAQVIAGGALRGRRVEFTGYSVSDGDAAPVVGMLSVVNGRPQSLLPALPSGSGSAWIEHRGVYEVPDDESVQLVLTVYVTGGAGTAWFDDVSVRVAGSPIGTDVEPADLSASVAVDASSIVRQIPRTLFGTNVEWRWNANYLWEEESRRLSADIVALSRELGVTLIRFPGGTLSDNYHWREGIGPREQRREVRHEIGSSDQSQPNFGTDEALEFARQVGGELLITVNAGTGSAAEAADWVRYVNGGSRRVTYWEVGNELYIREGSEMFERTTVDPGTYAKRFLEFAAAMRAVDPGIKIGAIGGENRGRYASVGYRDWNRTVLERAGDQIDFLAVHNAYAPLISEDTDLRTLYRAMLAAPLLIGRNLDAIAAQIARHVPARAEEIGIAVTEWGPAFQFGFGGRYVDHGKTLGSALFVASAMKAFIESSHVRMANFWLLNDMSVLGSIGTTDDSFPPSPKWAPTARFLALQLFARHFGEQLVLSTVQAPTFDTPAVGLVDAVREVPYLEVVSSLSADGRRLYLLAINKHFDADIEAEVSLRGFAPRSDATVWTLTGTGIDANTGTKVLDLPGVRQARQADDPQHRRFHRGGPDEVTLQESGLGGVGEHFTYSFPAHSVTSIVLLRQQ